jgi:hypothetical protein
MSVNPESAGIFFIDINQCKTKCKDKTGCQMKVVYSFYSFQNAGHCKENIYNRTDCGIMKYRPL